MCIFPNNTTINLGGKALENCTQFKQTAGRPGLGDKTTKFIRVKQKILTIKPRNLVLNLQNTGALKISESETLVQRNGIGRLV